MNGGSPCTRSLKSAGDVPGTQAGHIASQSSPLPGSFPLPEPSPPSCRHQQPLSVSTLPFHALPTSVLSFLHVTLTPPAIVTRHSQYQTNIHTDHAKKHRPQKSGAQPQETSWRYSALRIHLAMPGTCLIPGLGTRSYMLWGDCLGTATTEPGTRAHTLRGRGRRPRGTPHRT